MEAMGCNRSNCDNVMCITYTSEGYICHECKSEFWEFMETDISLENGSLKKQFKEFMETEKGHCEQDPENINWDKL